MKIRRYFYLLVSLGFLLCFPSILSFSSSKKLQEQTSVAAAELPSQKIKQLASAIAVIVEAGDSRGSGILIAKDGQTYTVVTNAHVVDRAESYRIKTPDGKIRSAKLKTKGDSFAGDDLALLEFSATDNYAIALLDNSATLSENQAIFAVGFPNEGDKLSVSRANISLVAEKPLVGGYQIGFSRETKQGMSGGALLNDKGALIGILGQGNEALIDNIYTYQDGSRPNAQTLARMRSSSFAVPINRVGVAIATEIMTNVDKIARQITVRIDAVNAAPVVSRQENVDSINHGNGSGVIISKQGNTYYVLTAGHVVKNPDEYELTTPDGEQYKINNQTVKTLEGVDLAIVPFTSQKAYQVATFADYYPLWGTGESVLFISGFPKDNNAKRKLTVGYGFPQSGASLTAYNAYSLTNGYELIYSNFSQPGMSGAPVLDSLGRVVGINAATEAEVTIDDAGQQVEIALGRSLGVPMATFLKLAPKGGLDPKSFKIDKNSVRGSFGGFLGTLGSIYSIVSSFDVPVPTSEMDAIAWLNYGNQLWRLHRHKEAIAAFEKAIKLKPDFYQAYHAKGLTFYSQYNWQGSLVAFEQVTQINPNSAEGWRMQAEIFNIMQKYQEALIASDRALKLNQNDAIVLMQRGLALMSLQRYSEASEAFNQSIELKPNAWNHTMRGSVRITAQDLPGALADFKRALELDPNFLLAYMSLGSVYSAQGNYQAALTTFDKAIELTSQMSFGSLVQGSMLSFRGMVRASSGDYQGAINDYSQGITKVLEDKKTSAYMSSFNINIPGADAKSTEILVSSLYYLRAAAYIELGNFQNTIADLDRAIEVQPDNTQAYVGRGMVRARLKETQLAIADLTKAAQLYKGQGNEQGYQEVQQMLQKLQNQSD